MKHISLGIVIAALAVSVPRLILAFLLGSGVDVSAPVEIAILTSTGVGSGIVLTVGNALLAHALATKARKRNGLWWISSVAWVLLVMGAVILVAPTLVAGLRRSALATVLTTPVGEWLWAVCAVAVVEVLVGAAMAAAVLVEQDAPLSSPIPPIRRASRWGIVWDAVVNRIAYALDPRTDERFVLAEAEDLFPEETLRWSSVDPSEPALEPAFRSEMVAESAERAPTASAANSERMHGGFVLSEPFLASPVLIESANDVNSFATNSGANVTADRSPIAPPKDGAEPLADVSFRARTKAEALERTIDYFGHSPHASVAEVAESIGRSESTVRGYLVELEAANRIERDGATVRILSADKGQG